MSAVVLPIINSIISVISSIFTAITASSCPIDIDNVWNILNEWHKDLKEITTNNTMSKAFKQAMIKRLKLRWEWELFPDWD